MTSPIRIGMIGLSGPGNWAVNAHLPYLKSNDQFKIVAVCNSSVDSAQKAIKTYDLGAETKAYGSPEDIAKDPNVQLVVCSVRVDRHAATITPALKAGKDVFVEWPLAKNLEQAEELLRLSKEGKVKTSIVGLQGRHAPLVHKVKALIKEGRIGKVLSSTWVGQAGNLGEAETVEYITDKAVGGNVVTIHFGHSVDYILQTLGEFETFHGLLGNQRKTIKLLNPDGSVLDKAHKKTSEDHIMIHGRLKDSGALLSINMRGGKPFKDAPGLDWRIYGETGEIRFTAGGPFVTMGYPDMTISLHDFSKDTVEKIEIPEDLEALPMPARNVGRIYNAIATGDLSLCCDFEDAVRRHRFIDELYKENP
ncbi:MAG: transcription regulator gal80 [Claussenomyces sp. TS43310]|nr:MAG: transcription regulator gal80 [Claussenomyces sp. TS43310]